MFDPVHLLEELGHNLEPVIHRVKGEADAELAKLRAEADAELVKLRSDASAAAEVLRADLEAALVHMEPAVAEAIKVAMSGSLTKLLSLLAVSAA